MRVEHLVSLVLGTVSVLAAPLVGEGDGGDLGAVTITNSTSVVSVATSTPTTLIVYRPSQTDSSAARATETGAHTEHSLAFTSVSTANAVVGSPDTTAVSGSAVAATSFVGTAATSSTASAGDAIRSSLGLVGSVALIAMGVAALA